MATSLLPLQSGPSPNNSHQFEQPQFNNCHQHRPFSQLSNSSLTQSPAQINGHIPDPPRAELPGIHDHHSPHLCPSSPIDDQPAKPPPALATPPPHLESPPSPNSLPKKKPKPDGILLGSAADPQLGPSGCFSPLPLTPTGRCWPEASTQPGHQLKITLLSAQGLCVPAGVDAGSLRPYAVLQFDQTESVTEEAGGTSPRARWRGLRAEAGSPSRLCALARTSTMDAGRPVWNHTAVFDVFRPKACVFISIYHRAAERDGFIGGTVAELAYAHLLDEGHATVSEDTLLLWDHAGQNRVGTIGVKIEISRVERVRKKIELDDFEVVRLVGEGSYGQVYRVRKKDTRRLYAMKVLSKARVLQPDAEGSKRSNLSQVLAERQILEKTWGCPFLVGLKFSFVDAKNLFLVMDLKSGGELMSYMQRFGGRFQESWVVFYTAEILSGLKFLHSMDIAYRDLKPENCLLDATGHVALCDFGLSKMDMTVESRTNTFCGTTEYIAPEVLLEQGYTRMVDFWSLGVLIFEMSIGWTPFFSEDRVTRYSLILESDISTKFPKRGVSEVTKDIVLRLLERDPAKRLGAQGEASEIEQHVFFGQTDWTALVNRRLTPPFKPRVESDAELGYADRQAGQDRSRTGQAVLSRRSSVEGGGGGRERAAAGASGGGAREEVFRDFTFARDGTLDAGGEWVAEDAAQAARRSSETRYL